MGIEEIYKKLKDAVRPIELFGDTSKEEIKKVYRNLAKKCHPDTLPPHQQALGESVMSLLNALYDKALKEFEEGIYNLTDDRDLYKKMTPSMEFDLSGENYKFYEHVLESDAGDIYKGIHEDDLVYLKVALDETDNDNIEQEYHLLSRLEHHSMPSVLDILKINGLSSIIFSDFKGMPFDKFVKEYGHMPGEHIVWMLERMLSALGYLHSNNVVHGNIKTGNIYINPDIHNIVLLDYALCIEEANDIASKYRIINDSYTAPEVSANIRVLPNTDIYAIGKLAIKLLGGDIKTNGMPVAVDARVREFIRKLVTDNPKNRPNDAYELWDEIIDIRDKVYGKQRFLKLEKKYKGGI